MVRPKPSTAAAWLTILQALPSEIITSLPNANVADALGRMASVTLERIEGEGVYIQVRGTEPRLTNVTINGITIPSPEPAARQIRLDVIPADLVQSVEINKTLSPNIDGDGIGGSVNWITKSAGEYPTFNLYGLGGYDPILGGRLNNQFGATIGHRFGKSKKLGLLFGGSSDYNGRGIDNEQPAIDTLSTFTKPVYDNNTIREYRYYRNRWGFTGTADYKLGDGSNIYIKGLYSNLQDYGDTWYYEPQATAAPKFYTSSKRPDASISGYSVGARKQFTSSLLVFGKFPQPGLMNSIPPVTPKPTFPGSAASSMRLRSLRADQHHGPTLRRRLRRGRLAPRGRFQLGLQGHHNFNRHDCPAEPRRRRFLLDQLSHQLALRYLPVRR